MTSPMPEPSAAPGSARTRSRNVMSERTITSPPMSSALKIARAGTTRPRADSTRRSARLRPGAGGGFVGVGSPVVLPHVRALARLRGLHDSDGPRPAHEQPELLRRRRLGVEDVHDPALVHH